MSTFNFNGNVGIRTNNPTYTLDVNGNINLIGNLYKNGILLSQTGPQGSTGSQGSTGPGFTTISNFGGGGILVSTGTNNSAITYTNFTYDGTILSAPTFTGSNIYASTQHFGNSSDSVTVPSYSWLGDTNCGHLIPLLTSAVQEQSVKIKKQQTTIQSLQIQIRSLQEQIDTILGSFRNASSFEELKSTI